MLSEAKSHFFDQNDTKKPLKTELKYFINHLNNKSIDIANGDSAIDVMNIITKATSSLLKG